MIFSTAKIIDATLWDLLLNFLLSLMIRSGVSFPCRTFYHHFATLKESQRSPFISFRLSNIAPSFKLFFKILSNFLLFYHRWCYAPWKTWVWVCHIGVSGVSVRHDEILPIQPPNLKKNGSSKTFFFPDASSAMYFYQHAATRSHLQPLAATRLAVSGRWSKWPQGASETSAWQPLAATRVAASGRSRQFQRSGRKCRQVAAFGQINFHSQSKRSGKSFWHGWFWGTPTSGNPIYNPISPHPATPEWSEGWFGVLFCWPFEDSCGTVWRDPFFTPR